MIKTLFVDIGGCLLTNGWDSALREKAASHFGLDLGAMNMRHEICFDSFEVGKITLDAYLHQVVFYEKRSFTMKEFQDFIYQASTPYPEMIELVKETKSRHNLKVYAVSNEGRELNEYRIQKYKLDTFIDTFISSCYVHLRKPDAGIYRLALDVSRMSGKEVLYIEDRPAFILAAELVGISGICHKEYAVTRQALENALS